MIISYGFLALELNRTGTTLNIACLTTLAKESFMRVNEVKIDGVYLFTKSGNEVRVLRESAGHPGEFEVERTTSGKKMIVNARALEEVPEYELD